MPNLMLPALALLAATAPPLPGATNQTRSTRFCDVPAESFSTVHAEVTALPTVRDRVLAASERFLGVAYLNDALGEGPGNPPDEDPTLRFDAVDCTTYVETVIALALAKSSSETARILSDIRYDAEPGWAQRNHFFVAQWLPANMRKGYVRDITSEIGGPAALAHTKVITARGWKARTRAKHLALPDERAPIGSFGLSYVPIEKVPAIAGKVPSGTLFAVVREDLPSAPLMVTHVGFIVQTPQGTVVRHAGRDRYAQVVDEELGHFLRRNARYRPWRVLGLQFLEILEGPAGVRL